METKRPSPWWVEVVLVLLILVYVVSALGTLAIAPLLFSIFDVPEVLLFWRQLLLVPFIPSLIAMGLALRYKPTTYITENDNCALGWPARVFVFLLSKTVFLPFAAATQLSSFIFTFSYVHWSASALDPNAFSEPLTKLDALYFTLTTFTTTGFGDISPRSPTARGYVSLQMALGFVLVSVLFALVITRMGSWLLAPDRD